MAIRGIIFDLDGTLIDSTPYHLQAFKMLLKDYGFTAPKRKILKLVGMSTLDILERLGRLKKSGLRLADLREERHYYYFKLIGQREIEFAGATKAVRKLKKQGYKIAIATGSSNIIYFHSTKKKFRELFNSVITIDDVANGKPAPDCLLLAAARLGLRPEDCIVVGDSKYDRFSAKAAGMDFIGVLCGIGSRKELGKIVLKSVRELPGFLAKKRAG